jgi:polyphosphate kinase 2 (PPK2 family)
VDLEQHLHRHGTRIVKFFLRLSKDEQRKRFIERIDDANKNWKFTADDKANARLIVSHIVLDTLQSLDLAYPQASTQRQRELQAIRSELEA